MVESPNRSFAGNGKLKTIAMHSQEIIDDDHPSKYQPIDLSGRVPYSMDYRLVGPTITLICRVVSTRACSQNGQLQAALAARRNLVRQS